MPIANAISGSCVRCQTMVWPGEGFLLSKEIVCQECSQKPPADEILIRRSAKAIEIKAKRFLGPDRFADFRTATEGVNYLKESKMNVVSLENLPPILRTLKDYSFVLCIDPEVKAMLDHQTAQEDKANLEHRFRLERLERQWADRGLALFPFQKKGADWLSKRRGALLADETGTGKTVQAIAAVADDVPIVVVCPSVAKGVWKRDFEKWRPEIAVKVLSGRDSFRWPVPGEAVIVNYDILPQVQMIECEDETVVTLPWNLDKSVPVRCTMIADEAHTLKSFVSNRSKSFFAMSEAVREQDGRVWLITATPLLNRPPELWNLLQLANIHQESFGNWINFYKLFDGTKVEIPTYESMVHGADPIKKTDWGKPKPEAVDRIRRVAIRRYKKDVLPELPERLYRTIVVDIPPMVVKLCDSAYEKARHYLDQKKMPEFEEMSYVRMVLAQEKLPFAIEWIDMMEEKGEPLLVFSAHRQPLDKIAARPGWKGIFGGVDAAQKTKIETDFQEGKLKGLALSIKAAGVAITLTRSAHELFIDRLYTPGLNEQAEERAIRHGQTRGVVVTNLVANHPLDIRLNEILSEKSTIIENSVGKI